VIFEVTDGVEFFVPLPLQNARPHFTMLMIYFARKEGGRALFFASV
jgi:hypothetical protein